MQKYKKLALKIIVSVGIFAFIYFKIDKEEFIRNLSLLDFRYAPLIILLIVLNYVVSSTRWKALLIYDNTDHISVKYLTVLYFVGSFFNNFMPTSIGGDVYKIYKLGKKINNTTHAFSATFMERFTGVLALGILSIVGITRWLSWGVVLLLIWSVLCFYYGFKVLAFLSTKNSKIKKIYDSLIMYKGMNKVLSFAFISSILVQVFSVLSQYFVFKALGIDIPLSYAFFVLPLITLASFFIPSLNGLGVQDALYTNLFSIVGVSTELSLSASVIYHLFRLVTSLFGGILYAMGKDE